MATFSLWKDFESVNSSPIKSTIKAKMNGIQKLFSRFQLSTINQVVLGKILVI
jgi:hypothetical protein